MPRRHLCRSTQWTVLNLLSCLVQFLLVMRSQRNPTLRYHLLSSIQPADSQLKIVSITSLSSLHKEVSIFNRGMFVARALSFLFATLQTSCLSSLLFVHEEFWGRQSLCFFFLLAGAVTAEDMALELIHDDVVSPIIIEPSYDPTRDL